MKAILVIDMPKSCADCKLADFGRCWGTYSYVHMRLDDIPVDCPLKPIHALKSAGHDYIIYERQYLYKNLEREYELMKEAREYESNISS